MGMENLEEKEARWVWAWFLGKEEEEEEEEGSHTTWPLCLSSG